MLEDVQKQVLSVSEIVIRVEEDKLFSVSMVARSGSLGHKLPKKPFRLVIRTNIITEIQKYNNSNTIKSIAWSSSHLHWASLRIGQMLVKDGL